MTNDQSLLQPAQYALNHIVYAQDPVGGGWRYSAKQPGDTSAVGWQLMALKSGHMGYLQVPPQTKMNLGGGSVLNLRPSSNLAPVLLPGSLDTAHRLSQSGILHNNGSVYEGEVAPAAGVRSAN